MAQVDVSVAVSAIGDGVALRVKVVPGASRSRCMGLLGDRLKLAVAAPPTGGQANKAVCELVAELLDVPLRNVVIAAGHGQAIKTVNVIGVGACAVVEKLRGLTR